MGTDRMGNIFANGTLDKGLVTKMYKQLIQFNTRKTGNPIFLKNGQSTRIDISPGRTYRWPIDI